MRCAWCLNTLAKGNSCKITGSVLCRCETQTSLLTRMAVYFALSYLYPHKISRRIRWVGHAACVGDKGGVYRVLVGKPEGKWPLGRLGINWRKLLKWIFKNWKRGMDWIDMAQNGDWSQALVNAVPFHKMWGVSWLGEDMLAYDEGLLYGATELCIMQEPSYTMLFQQWFSYKITKWLCKTCNSYLYYYGTFPVWRLAYQCTMTNYSMYTHCSILYLAPLTTTVDWQCLRTG
jgi:hypothetical protein